MGSSGGEQRTSQVGLRGWWPCPNTGGWGSCPQVSARDSPAVRLCPDAVSRAGKFLLVEFMSQKRQRPPPHSRPFEESPSEGGRPHELWEAKRPES